MIREHSAGCTLSVRAQPGAKKTAITGMYGEGDQAALKIAVHASPIDGRANEALIGFLAGILHVPKLNVQLLSGSASRSKLFLLRGVAVVEVEAAIVKAAPAGNHSPGDHFTGTE